jgi:uncharacterized membrane protein HdeD (DUF308 family)
VWSTRAYDACVGRGVSEERIKSMADVAQPQPMLSGVAGRVWWTLVLRGVVAVLFVLILFFGAYTLVDGIFAIVGGIMDSSRRWLLLIEGVLGVVAGLILLARPGLGALVLLYVIAIWAIVTGVMEILAAISLRREIDNEWLMILGGALSVLFGVILAILPGAGLLSLTWLIGVYALVFGVAFIFLGFRVRGLGASSTVR